MLYVFGMYITCIDLGTLGLVCLKCICCVCVMSVYGWFVCWYVLVLYMLLHVCIC